jgi:hypothetical protein
VKTRMFLGAALLCVATTLTTVASADPWEVRREWREGAREVAHERREAAREIHNCRTRECVWREMREGEHEVNRERRETRREVTRERAGDGWYRNVRYDNRYDPYRYAPYRYVGAHYHPDGHYCRDVRHVAHLRDAYYRGDRRWYRDGRDWNEYDYVTRYYRGGDGDDDDDLVKGILIGAAAVGVIAAIHEANDGD